MRRVPAGVAVVTVETDGRAVGLTVASLVSLSLDPPLVGFAIRRDAALHELLRESQELAVSILAAGQEHLAQHFARGVPPIALWERIPLRDPDAHGPPQLADAARAGSEAASSRSTPPATTPSSSPRVAEARTAGPRQALAPAPRPGLRCRCDRRRRLRPRRRAARLRAGLGRRPASSSPRARRPLARPARSGT